MGCARRPTETIAVTDKKNKKGKKNEKKKGTGCAYKNKIKRTEKIGDKRVCVCVCALGGGKRAK